MFDLDKSQLVLEHRSPITVPPPLPVRSCVDIALIEWASTFCFLSLYSPCHSSLILSLEDIRFLILYYLSLVLSDSFSRFPYSMSNGRYFAFIKRSNPANREFIFSFGLFLHFVSFSSLLILFSLSFSR